MQEEDTVWGASDPRELAGRSANQRRRIWYQGSLDCKIASCFQCPTTLGHRVSSHVIQANSRSGRPISLPAAVLHITIGSRDSYLTSIGWAGWVRRRANNASFTLRKTGTIRGFSLDHTGYF